MSEWRNIETDPPPRGDVLRYEPPTYRKRDGSLELPARITVSSGAYPRKASHWMPLPEPPKPK